MVIPYASGESKVSLEATAGTTLEEFGAVLISDR